MPVITFGLQLPGSVGFMNVENRSDLSEDLRCVTQQLTFLTEVENYDQVMR